MVGRNREPAALSCSNRCSQTRKSHLTTGTINASEVGVGMKIRIKKNSAKYINAYVDQAEVVLIDWKLL